MSFYLSGLAWKARLGSSTDKLVLLAMADTAKDSGECWPGIDTLAEKCEASEDTVRRAIQRLVAAGFLIVEPRFDANGRQMSNRYRIIEEALVGSSMGRVANCNPTPANCPPTGVANCPPLEPIRGTSNLFPPSEPPQPGKRKPKKPDAPFLLPAWLPQEAWDQFEQHRREIGQPLTNLAREKSIKTLQKLKADGDEPADVIDQSIQARWAGLFPLKKNFRARMGYPSGSRAEQQKETADAIWNRTGEAGDEPADAGEAGNGQRTLDGVARRVD